MSEKTMPPLPSGSVDLAALHAADAKGNDLSEAVASATERKPVPEAKTEDGKTSVKVPTADFRLTEKAGGWWEITGPTLDKPFKTQDEGEARSKFADLSGTDTATGDDA